jgi:hypothetical protein
LLGAKPSYDFSFKTQLTMGEGMLQLDLDETLRDAKILGYFP